MTDTVLGFVLAVLGSISFGAYILPRKLSKLSVLDYQYWLAIVIAPFCIVVAIVAGAGLAMQPTMLGLSLLCGVIWTFGSLSYSSAVDNVGVTRSTPIKNMAPVFAAIYGIILFQEYSLANPVALAMTVSGVLFMVAAAFLIGRASALEHEKAFAYDVARSAEERRRSFGLGIAFSLGAAFFYGAYSAPLKYLFKKGVSAYAVCAWLGVGVLITTVLIYIVKERRLAPRFPGRREFLLAQGAGAIWTSGQLLGALAMLYIPMSISWPVSNLGTLVAVAWGVYIFKEVHIEKHIKEFALGLVLYVAGLTLLAMAAPGGHV
ncbi:MAG: GRP family sugar transporter [Fimbriimonadales bacterium]